MIVKLLTEHHLEFLSLKGGCRGSSESTLVKISNCWKSHAAAHVCFESPEWSYFKIWLNHNNLQNVWTKKEMWPKILPLVKYAPSSDKGPVK